MNGGVLIGIIAFLAWGTASSWWYVCKIKNYCEDQTEEVIKEPVDRKMTENQQEEVPVEPVPEPVRQELTEVTQPIEISYSTVKFAKNRVGPLNPEALEEIIRDIGEAAGTSEISIEIVGHTCDLGSEEHNRMLGLDRAASVKRIIESQLEAEISIQSEGESSPLNDNASEQERAINRRVELNVKITPK